MQGCIVAEQRHAGEAHELPLGEQVQGLAGAPDLPDGLVAPTRDGEDRVAQRDPLDGHLVPGQRARLVRADDADRAQRLDRRQAADDGVARCHAAHADGERYGHHGGQPLGNGGHGEAYAGHEHVEQRLAPDQRAEGDRRQRQGQDGAREAAREDGHLANERRLQRLDLAEQTADPADLGGAARGGDDAPAVPACHQRAGIGHRAPVAERGVSGHRLRALLGRHRFARQRRLLHGQTTGLGEAQVGRNPIARLEQDLVAGDEPRGVDRPPVAVAEHARVGRQHAADRPHRRLGPALLDEAHDGVDENDPEDDARVDELAEEHRCRAGDEKDVDQHVVELAKEPPRRGKPDALRQPVGAVSAKPGRRLLVAEAIGRSAEATQRVLGGQSVPAGRSAGRRRSAVSHLASHTDPSLACAPGRRVGDGHH